MSKFLDNLANALDQQFSVGENTNHSLSDVVDGKGVRYAKLGDFASKFDQSAERRYLEEGYLRKDTYNVDTKMMQILTQHPDITVLVKKRMFSSLSENFRLDHMDSEERLFYKASKILFENKTKQIAAVEKLSKIEKIVEVNGRVNDLLVPLIINLSDQAYDNFGFTSPGVQNGLSKMKSITDRLKSVYAYSGQNQYTTWIRNHLAMFQAPGDGTGVIEITNVSNISTRVNVNSINSKGGCDFSIVDPYELCSITELDIERAISDAANTTYNRKFFQVGKQSIEEILERNKSRLNGLRAARGAGPIQFHVNADTIYGRRVIAILDRIGKEVVFQYDSGFAGIGGKVKVDSSFLIGGAVGSDVGDEGISTEKSKTPAGSSVRRLYSDSELTLFEDIVKGIFEKIQLEKNSLKNVAAGNGKSNYVRRKMRMHFLGKSIIQPMDVVHVYINSKTATDNKIMGGIKDTFNYLNFSQKLANTFTTIENIAGKFDPKHSIDFQIEKSVFVGEDFPNALWSQMRNLFVKEDCGTHVFGGIVDSVSNSGSPGDSMISVSCSDNTSYFDMGVVNFNPSADVFNGSLYDPLTPFQTRFDETSINGSQSAEKLLDENKVRLATGIIRHKSGSFVGQTANDLNIGNDIFVDSNGRISRVMHAPDGMVYRWKEGIGVLQQFGEFADINTAERVGNQSITKNPFAGQDVMNVISLSITGDPYNYNTYYQSVAKLQGGLNDNEGNVNGAHSFYKSFTTDLARRNMMWGNFIPFKNLTMSPAQYKSTLNTISQITNVNNTLNKALTRIQLLKEALPLVDGIDRPTQVKITTQINEIRNNEDVKKQLEVYKNSVSENITLQGNDVDLNFDGLLNNGISKNYNSNLTARNIRRKLNFLTRRLSYMVKANEDKNLLIIDDSYDQDYDIMAFEKELQNNLELYRSDFTSVRESIGNVARLLNLEVFCDTQGHIRVRPPQYNRMPSSVFYRMMVMKSLNNIQVFPQFLNDLFLNQFESLKTRLEVCEDYLRLYVALIKESNQTDSEVEQFLTSETKSSATGSNGFRFISDQNGNIDITTDMINEVKSLDDLDKSSKINFQTIKAQKNLKEVFNPISAFKVLSPQSSQQERLTNIVKNNLINNIIERIGDKSKQKVNVNELSLTTQVKIDGSVDVSIGITDRVNFEKVYNDLLFRVSERQKLLTSLHGCIRNLVEARSVDTDPSAVNKALFPNLAGNREIPETLEHLIQDESFDDYGPGSGSRYIISNNKVKSYSISENPPEYTKIDVRGMIDPFIQSGGDELNTGMTTASAIDYDTWRMYGLRDGGVHSVPFLNTKQVAPFATILLSIARKNILRGNITIVGNEFMQPGDVVFLEQKNLLFYVKSVNHSFNYGGSFETRLDVEYGHPPGEYIPTYLDSIGKLLYLNKDDNAMVNYRQSSSANEKNIGILIADPSVSASSLGEINAKDVEDKSLKSSNFAANNNKVIEDILWTAGYAMNASNSGGSTAARIELRTYYNTADGQSNDPNRPSYILAAAISDVLKTGITKKKDGKLETIVPGLGKDTKIISYSDDNSRIDLDPSKDIKKSPSSKAWNTATELSNKYSPSSISVPGAEESDKKQASKLKKMLYTNVVDCWIVFETVDKSDNKK